jgi:hypothetical protein
MPPETTQHTCSCEGFLRPTFESASPQDSETGGGGKRDLLDLLLPRASTQEVSGSDCLSLWWRKWTNEMLLAIERDREGSDT